jgi:hypothetical protein
MSQGRTHNITIVNNTFYGSVSTAISFDESSVADQHNNIVANNIFHMGTGKLAWIENNTGITFKNNFWAPSLVSSGTGALGQNDKAGDPKFATTPGITPESYILSSSSPAINIGASIAGVTDDLGNSPWGQLIYWCSRMRRHHGPWLRHSTPTPTPAVDKSETDYSAWLVPQSSLGLVVATLVKTG